MVGEFYGAYKLAKLAQNGFLWGRVYNYKWLYFTENFVLFVQ